MNIKLEKLIIVKSKIDLSISIRNKFKDHKDYLRRQARMDIMKSKVERVAKCFNTIHLCLPILREAALRKFIFY